MALKLFDRFVIGALLIGIVLVGFGHFGKGAVLIIAAACVGKVTGMVSKHGGV